MTGPVALKAAYIVTWVILLSYLGSLLRRFRRVREEMKDLKRGGCRQVTKANTETK
jgi:CcmD family protein